MTRKPHHWRCDGCGELTPLSGLIRRARDGVAFSLCRDCAADRIIATARRADVTADELFEAIEHWTQSRRRRTTDGSDRN